MSAHTAATGSEMSQRAAISKRSRSSARWGRCITWAITPAAHNPDPQWIRHLSTVRSVTRAIRRATDFQPAKTVGTSCAAPHRALESGHRPHCCERLRKRSRRHSGTSDPHRQSLHGVRDQGEGAWSARICRPARLSVHRSHPRLCGWLWGTASLVDTPGVLGPDRDTEGARVEDEIGRCRLLPLRHEEARTRLTRLRQHEPAGGAQNPWGRSRHAWPPGNWSWLPFGTSAGDLDALGDASQYG